MPGPFATITSPTRFSNCELVRLLAERHAESIVLVGAPVEFVDDAQASAARYGYGRLRRGSAVDVPASAS